MVPHESKQIRSHFDRLRVVVVVVAMVVGAGVVVPMVVAVVGRVHMVVAVIEVVG